MSKDQEESIDYELTGLSDSQQVEPYTIGEFKQWFYEHLRSFLVKIKILKQRRSERLQQEREQLQSILEFELEKEVVSYKQTDQQSLQQIQKFLDSLCEEQNERKPTKKEVQWLEEERKIEKLEKQEQKQNKIESIMKINNTNNEQKGYINQFKQQDQKRPNQQLLEQKRPNQQLLEQKRPNQQLLEQQKQINQFQRFNQQTKQQQKLMQFQQQQDDEEEDYAEFESGKQQLILSTQKYSQQQDQIDKIYNKTLLNSYTQSQQENNFQDYFQSQNGLNYSFGDEDDQKIDNSETDKVFGKDNCISIQLKQEILNFLREKKEQIDENERKIQAKTGKINKQTKGQKVEQMNLKLIRELQAYYNQNNLGDNQSSKYFTNITNNFLKHTYEAQKIKLF